MNILLSSVGRRVELVRAFRAAYRRLGVEGSIVGTDMDWLAPAFQEIDRPIGVPRFDHPDYLDTVIRVCEEFAIAAVFPLNDGELRLLSENREAIEQTGAQVAVVDSKSVAVCADKWKTYEFFRHLGLPTAESWVPTGQVDAERFSYPLFIKPRDGSAGVSAFPIRDPDEYRFFTNYVRNPIVQELLPGPEVTTDVVCDFAGRVLSIVSRKRIAVRGGEAIKSVTIQDDRIEQACREIASQLPARGPITVQSMMKDGIPHFVEINGRLGGGLPLAVAAGVDVPALLLATVAGLSLAGLERRPKLGVYMTRCDESFFLTEPTGETTASHHIRSR